jgi:polar amino acid transport system substrate-binding protein
MIKNTFYLFIFIFQVSLYAKSEIRFAADPWCPFTCEPGTSHEGLIIEISRKIFEDAGYVKQYWIQNSL